LHVLIDWEVPGERNGLGYSDSFSLFFILFLSFEVEVGFMLPDFKHLFSSFLMV